MLANIYLDRLDKFVEQTLLPAHTRGAGRRINPAYNRLNANAYYHERMGRKAKAQAMRRRLDTLPTTDPFDPEYRRLRYVRYADDFLLGFIGPRHEAEAIKQRLQGFLHEPLKLELSETKTLITHARTGAARFLGYDIGVLHNNSYRSGVRHGRNLNGKIGLTVPVDLAWQKCRKYMRGNKPTHRTELTHNSDFEIVTTFQQEYRGFAEYYRLAYNRSTRLQRLKWVMEVALTKTLAAKLRISVPKVYQRYGTTIHTTQGRFKGLVVQVPREGKPPLVAQWGGISLARWEGGDLNDHVVRPHIGTTDLLQRLLADACELCNSREQVQVHHVRHLRDLRRNGRADKPRWVQKMAARQRKTLVVCHTCHAGIHAGDPQRRRRRQRTRDTGEPDAANVARPVRRGAVGKGPG